MPNISAYTGPLQTICTNNLPFFWMPLHHKCFDTIKTLACKTLALKLIIWTTPEGLSKGESANYRVWVITNACPAGVRAILAQGVSWELSQPTAFMSKKFTSTQCSYFVYKLEALGVLEALSKWMDELTGGQKFMVMTDHKAPMYFKEKQHTSSHHI